MLAFEQKILTLAQLVAVLPQWQGKKWVLTNGVFDILHRGHVSYLQEARNLGDYLVVAVNTDESVRRLGKAANRPLNPLADRMAVLAALAAVDVVVSFNEDNAATVIAATHPPIYAKGGDYTLSQTPEGKVVQAYGGACHEIAFVHNRSTTSLVERISRGA